MATKKSPARQAAAAAANRPLPSVGPCRPVFATEQEVRSFFDDFRDSVSEDLRELAAARRRGEESLMRGFAP